MADSIWLVIISSSMASVAMLVELVRAIQFQRSSHEQLAEHGIVISSALLTLALAALAISWATMTGWDDLRLAGRTLLAATFVPLSIYLMISGPVSRAKKG